MSSVVLIIISVSDMPQFGRVEIHIYERQKSYFRKSTQAWLLDRLVRPCLRFKKMSHCCNKFYDPFSIRNRNLMNEYDKFKNA